MLSEYSQSEAIDIDETPESEIYVKFIWSENEHIKDNSIFKFDQANDLLSRLETINRTKGFYDKTKFELYLDKECLPDDKFYEGRFDAGDGYAADLKEHLYKSVTEYQNEMGLSDKTRSIFLNMIGVKEPEYTKTKDIQHNKEI